MRLDYLFYLVGVACYSIAGYANFAGFSNLSSVFMPAILGFLAIGIGYSLKKERRVEEKEIVRDVVMIRCKRCAGLILRNQRTALTVACASTAHSR
jgi:hypothetical protein